MARERLELADGDFLDLDWCIRGGGRLAVLCHGLEGSSRDHYMRGMTRALGARGWDVLAWNYRGCGGEPNRLLSSYHSGKTDDLDAVIRHALTTRDHRTIDLVGFSLGGNLILKYLGESPGRTDRRLRRAVVFSVPCDLACSAGALSKWRNRLYMGRFLRALTEKLAEKDRRFPGRIDLSGLEKMSTFAEFDDRFTAPLHGFQSALDYWSRSSSRQFLNALSVPTLLVNAANDPFLGPRCYPFAEAEANPRLFLEVPD